MTYAQSRINCYRDETWAEKMKMNCFLSVGRGSVNKSVFLEVHYKGSEETPLVLVGKGLFTIPAVKFSAAKSKWRVLK